MTRNNEAQYKQYKIESNGNTVSLRTQFGYNVSLIQLTNVLIRKMLWQVVYFLPNNKNSGKNAKEATSL